jgi:hypothetical protein
LWKPLLTQYTLSEAHRNAQCVGSIPDSFIYPFFLVLLQLENFPLWNISSLRMANGDLFV